MNVFTGFPAEALLVDGSSVIGVRTTPSGLKRDGTPGGDFRAGHRYHGTRDRAFGGNARAACAGVHAVAGHRIGQPAACSPLA